MMSCYQWKAVSRVKLMDLKLGSERAVVLLTQLLDLLLQLFHFVFIGDEAIVCLKMASC